MLVCKICKMLLALAFALGCGLLEATPVSKTVEIAPGVNMPRLNCGGTKGKPSNYTAFFTLGGRGVDTALEYGTPIQESLGEAIKSSGLARTDVFLTTKVPCCPQKQLRQVCAKYSGSIADDVAQDLRELEVDYVDLMLLHWPCDTVEETATQFMQLQGLVKSGRARAVGISNFNSTLIEALVNHPHMTVKPVVNQCGYSIGSHDAAERGGDDATREFCRANGIAFEAYSPLGGGKIDVLGNKEVQGIASAHGVSTAQVALRWIAQQGGLMVTSANNTEYLQEDLDIYGFQLTPDQMSTLSAI